MKNGLILDCLSNGIFGKVKNSICAFFGGFRVDKKIYFLFEVKFWFVCQEGYLFGKAKNSTWKAKNSTGKAKIVLEKQKIVQRFFVCFVIKILLKFYNALSHKYF